MSSSTKLISDFLNVVYPSQDGEGFQSEISKLKEFQGLSAKTGEPLPSRGKLFAHQKFFNRFNDIYDRSLLLAEPGTGKSISFLSVAEDALASGLYNHIYIIEPRKSLIAEMREQLVFKAAQPGKYDTPAVLQAKTKVQKNSEITKEISRNYTFLTTRTFAKFVQAIKSDSEITSTFSGSVIIVDEAHNLITSTEETVAVETARGTKGADVKGTRVSDAYTELKRVVGLAHRTKMILATATPMINTTREIIPLINLLLVESGSAKRDSESGKLVFNYRRTPFPPNFDFEKAEYDTDVDPKIRGMISYVRAERSGIKVNYVGESILDVSDIFDGSESDDETPDETSLGILTYPSRMQGIQAEVFSEIILMREKDSFNVNGLQSSSFVFPDGSFGGVINGADAIHAQGSGGIILSLATMASKKKTSSSARGVGGLSTYIRVAPTDGRAAVTAADKKKAFVRYELIDADEEMPEISKTSADYYYAQGNPKPPGRRAPRLGVKGWINQPGPASKLENLKQLSAKFASIVEIEIAEFKTLGTSFVYTEYVNGGGAILLGLCLEEFGFRRFNPADTATSGRKTPKYAMILGDTPPTHIESILRTFKSPENYDGSLIKTIVGTRVLREGINLAHVVRVHLLVPGWTASGITQAVARALRADSHDVLYNQIIARMNVAGASLTKEQIREKAKIDVKIYRHISFSEIQTDPDSEDLGFVSVDLNVYHRIIEKDLRIRGVFNMLKRSAVDCAFNYERNVTIPLQQGSISAGNAECDYGKCEYKCGPSNTDVSLPRNASEVKDSVYNTRIGLKIPFSVENNRALKGTDSINSESYISKEFVLKGLIKWLQTEGKCGFSLTDFHEKEVAPFARIGKQTVAVTALELVDRRPRIADHLGRRSVPMFIDNKLTLWPDIHSAFLTGGGDGDGRLLTTYSSSGSVFGVLKRSLMDAVGDALKSSEVSRIENVLTESISDGGRVKYRTISNKIAHAFSSRRNITYFTEELLRLGKIYSNSNNKCVVSSPAEIELPSLEDASESEFMLGDMSPTVSKIYPLSENLHRELYSRIADILTEFHTSGFTKVPSLSGGGGVVCISSDVGYEVLESMGGDFASDMKLKKQSNYLRILDGGRWRFVIPGAEADSFTSAMVKDKTQTPQQTQQQQRQTSAPRTNLPTTVTGTADPKRMIGEVFGTFMEDTGTFRIVDARTPDKAAVVKNGQNCQSILIPDLVTLAMSLDAMVTGTKILKVVSGKMNVEDSESDFPPLTEREVSDFNQTVRVKTRLETVLAEITKLNNIYEKRIDLDPEKTKVVSEPPSSSANPKRRKFINVDVDSVKDVELVNGILKTGRNSLCLYIRLLLEYKNSLTLGHPPIRYQDITGLKTRKARGASVSPPKERSISRSKVVAVIDPTEDSPPVIAIAPQVSSSDSSSDDSLPDMTPVTPLSSQPPPPRFMVADKPCPAPTPSEVPPTVSRSVRGRTVQAEEVPTSPRVINRRTTSSRPPRPPTAPAEEVPIVIRRRTTSSRPPRTTTSARPPRPPAEEVPTSPIAIRRRTTSSRPPRPPTAPAEEVPTSPIVIRRRTTSSRPPRTPRPVQQAEVKRTPPPQPPSSPVEEERRVIRRTATRPPTTQVRRLPSPSPAPPVRRVTTVTTTTAVSPQKRRKLDFEKYGL